MPHGAQLERLVLLRVRRGRAGADPASGAEPTLDPWVAYHEVWRANWCGLGNFDTKYGYESDDRAAADYSDPILARDHGVVASWRRPEQFSYLKAFWSTGRYHDNLPLELPRYDDAVSIEIPSNIRNDPARYARPWEPVHGGS